MTTSGAKEPLMIERQELNNDVIADHVARWLIENNL